MSASLNVGQMAFSGALTAIFHPTGYAKVLVQLGHEPIKPTLSKNIFGKDVYYYPNIFKYTNYIWETDGFLGMYRGFLPRFVGGRIGTVVEALTLAKLKEGEEKEKETEQQEEFADWVKTCCIQTGQETISKCAGIIISQPFNVIMIRQMAQFIGGEKQYEGFFGSIKEIYNTDGISGFFSGLMPRLLGEIIQIWLSSVLAHLINKYIVDSKEAQSYIGSFVGLLVANITYPFTLVSNVMAVAGTDLVAATPPRMPPCHGWRECWSQLSVNGQLKRGSKFFFRTYTGPLIYKEGRQIPAMAMF